MQDSANLWQRTGSGARRKSATVRGMKLKFAFVPLLVAVGVCLATLPLRAGTNGFIVPPFRGSAKSQAGYWETFSTAVGAPGNLPDKPGATTGALLTQTSPTAFLTGSGNIYNLNGTSAFTLSNATPFTLGTVVLQTRTLGTELDYNSMTLSFTNEFGTHTLAPLPRVELNRGNQPGLGATVSSLWQWNLTGSNISTFVIAFHAAGPSTSFDSLTLDTSTNSMLLFTQPFHVNDTAPVIERWMYANNAAPCDRPAGSTFGVFGDDSGVDTRLAQHLIGWDTGLLLPTNRGPANYLLTRARVTLTINRGNIFIYDPTHDHFFTYFETNHPSYVTDSDAGRPVELFGAGYRNGFNAVTFDPCALLGSDAPGQRNAFAAGWSTNGTLVDVGNNVGKTNAAFPRFEVQPFAVGQTTNVAPGQLVPVGAKITFDLNLADPFVLAYVQSALHTGHLRLMVSSLHLSGGQFGGPSYPDFVTHFNEAVLNPTRLEIDGVVSGAGDLDADGLPDDWELFQLNGLTGNGAADSDADGASNLKEFRAGTNPSNATNALRILSMTRDGDTTTLRFPHAAHRTYALEYTGDFQSWLTLTNAPVFELESGTALWRDTSGATTNRFYRVRATP